MLRGGHRCRWRSRTALLLASAVAVGIPTAKTAQAANGIWTTNSSTAWSVTGSWSGGIVADGAGFKADFASGVDITGNRTVTLDTVRTIGSLVFDDDSHAFIIAGANTLTLDASGGTSFITSGPRHLVTFNVPMVGSGTISFGSTTNLASPPANVNGIGIVALNNAANDLTGNVSIDTGLVRVMTSFASIRQTAAQSVTINADGVLDTDFDFDEATWKARLVASSGGSLALRSNITSADVTDFASLHLGAKVGQTVTLNSVTLAGADTAYNFGGGGGTLNLNFNLVDGDAARELRLRSPTSSESAAAAHLTTVQLSGAANTFSGNTFVGQHTLAVYPNVAAMGAGTGRFLTVENVGYVTLQTATNLQTDLLDKIATTSAGVLALTGDRSDNLDFSPFADLRLGAVGTSVYSGNLAYANGATARFGGLGNLTVSQSLPNNIGAIEVAFESVSGMGQSSTVRFTADNSGLNVPVNVGVTGTNVSTTTLLVGSQAEIGSGAIAINNTNGVVRLLDGAVLSNNVTMPNTGGAKTFGTSGSSGAATLNGNLTSNDTTDRDSAIDVSSGMTLTINGQISGSGDIEKQGAGLLILTNPANTITQRFDLSAGTLRFTYNVSSTFANAASNGIFLRGGSLELPDGITVAEGLTHDNSGGNREIRLQDNVAFTGTVTGNIAMNDDTAGYEHDFNANDGVLTLQGNLTGTSLSGIDIHGDNARQGTVTFTGGTGFTKRMRLESGYFRIGEEADLGTAPAAFSADHLLLSGGHLETAATFTIDDATRGISVDANSNIRVFDGATLTIQVPLAGTSNTVGYIKRGGGTLVLNRAATSIADFTLNQGTLRLDFAAVGAPTTQILTGAAGTTFTLGGGALEVNGALLGANTQSFGDTVINYGNSKVSVQAGAGGTSGVNLGAITRNVGGYVDFTLNTGATVATTSGTADTLLTNVAGAIGIAYATVGGADWAAKDSTNTNIIAGSGAFYTASSPTSLSGNADVTAGDVSIDASSTPASIRFNEAAARNVTIDAGINLTTGGILISPNVGANAVTITGGNLRSASTTANLDLVVIQNNPLGDLTIGSTITNNSNAKALTKAGPGRLILTGTNTYTGQTFLTDGTLSISSNANLGAVATGAKITIDGGTLETTATFALDNAGANLRAVSLGDRGGTFATATGTTLTISGVVDRDGADASVNGLTKTGAGTLLLRGINIYSGVTNVSAGTLQVGDDTSTTAITGNNSTRNVLSVSASATLTGTGTIAGAGAATPHSIAGFLSPGSTTTADGDGEAALTFNGSLSLLAGSTTTLSVTTPTGNAGAGVDVLNLPNSHPALLTGTVAAGTHDHLAISHLLSLTGGAQIVVDASTLGGYANPAAGDVFNLVDAGALSAGTFNPGPRFQDGTEVGQDLDLPVLANGLTWDAALLPTHGVLVVVPEPGAALLLAMAGIGLLGGRRRRTAGR